MGGYGSGRIGGKILTSQMTELDVRLLHRCGLLRKDVLFPLDQQLKGSNVLIRIDSHTYFLNIILQIGPGNLIQSLFILNLTGHLVISAVTAHGFFVQIVEDEPRFFMEGNISIAEFVEIWRTQVKMSQNRIECSEKLTKSGDVLNVNLEYKIAYCLSLRVCTRQLLTDF